jgi:hypothetical protein
MGYVYLLVLGITSDSVLYGILGVNIINFSTVLDILLSPVIYLTKGIAFAVVILVIPALLVFQINNKQRKLQKELDATQTSQREALSKQIQTLKTSKLLLPAMIILSAYVGYAVGYGIATKNSLNKGEVKTNYEITFTDGETAEVRLVGHNSQYIFYAMEGKKELTISPIQGNVKRMDKLRKAK